jgi:hypothetical protein
MFKELAKKIFCTIFLFIFFAKMVISVAPLIISQIDGRSVHAVIMQLEIENQSPKESETKELSSKTDWFHYFQQYNFTQALVTINKSKVFSYQNCHIQSFYPPVPTPPPNV